ncbi:hypothetical protein ACU6U9_18655 [Pseudomonas sp. HK3]
MIAQAYVKPTTTDAAGTLLGANLADVRGKVLHHLEDISKAPERRLTAVPGALQAVTQATSGYEELHEQTGKGISQSVDEVLAFLRGRVDEKYGLESFNKIDNGMTEGEKLKFDATVDQIVTDPKNDVKTKDQAIALLLSKVVNASLESRSFQYYQLATFTRLLDFVQQQIGGENGESVLNTLMTWADNGKYSHYVSASPEGQKRAATDSPLHAIQLVMERVEADLQRGDQISPATARDMAGLTTIIASIFSSDMKANATERGLNAKAPAELAEGRPGLNLKTAMSFMTGTNYGSTYSEVAGGEDHGAYPSSPFGPSMTAFRAVRFIEVVLGGSRQEQAVYAATQGNDWDVNSQSGGKYATDLFSAHMGGAHSVFEALMTKENAVGFEVNLDTTRQTLMRLFSDVNVDVVNGEVNVDRNNKAGIDIESTTQEGGVLEEDIQTEALQEDATVDANNDVTTERQGVVAEEGTTV